MLEKMWDSYFGIKRKNGAVYPPSRDRGGIIMPHIPTDDERKNCGYAQEGYDCSKVRVGLIGGKRTHTINCQECPYHPTNQLIKQEIRTKIRHLIKTFSAPFF